MPETRRKISENNARQLKGKFGKDHPAFGHKVSANHHENLKLAHEASRGKRPWNYGKILPSLSEEHKAKIRKSYPKTPKPKISCPHCGKIGAKANMIQWHFNNCKEIVHCS